MCQDCCQTQHETASEAKGGCPCRGVSGSLKGRPGAVTSMSWTCKCSPWSPLSIRWYEPPQPLHAAVQQRKSLLGTHLPDYLLFIHGGRIWLCLVCLWHLPMLLTSLLVSPRLTSVCGLQEPSLLWKRPCGQFVRRVQNVLQH